MALDGSLIVFAATTTIGDISLVYTLYMTMKRMLRIYLRSLPWTTRWQLDGRCHERHRQPKQQVSERT